mmetsp:Transcript_114965/g.199304  ORF Transcript_114965/g.199304 Transcript_114965/m.199304 type:complete len:263 (+) Transcript_114965:837-1625(+)
MLISVAHDLSMSHSSSSSSPLRPVSSNSDTPAFAAFAFRASRSWKEALINFKPNCPMCRTCSLLKIPGPALLRHFETPSALVVRASTLASPASSPGTTRFMNSWHNCASTEASPPSRALPQSSPHVSNVRSRMVSFIVNSNTGRSACAVCGMNGPKCLRNFVTMALMHSSACCRSSSSEVLMMKTFGLPSSPRTTEKPTVSLPPMSSCAPPSSFGASCNFARIIGRRCGTKGKKSSSSVLHNRSAAAIMYSSTGSSFGMSGI